MRMPDQDLWGYCIHLESLQLRNTPTSRRGIREGRKGNTNGDLPESVEAVLGAVDGEDRGAGVGLCHAPVPLQDDNFGPDLVVDRMPLAENLIDVVLKDREEQCKKVTRRGRRDKV